MDYANKLSGLSATVEQVPAENGRGEWRTKFRDDDAGAILSIVWFATRDAAIAKARAFVDGVLS